MDGLLPSKLSYVNKGRHVPVMATCLVCFVIALLGTFFDIKVNEILMMHSIHDCLSKGFNWLR